MATDLTIGADALEDRLRGLDDIGSRPDGWHRLAWTDEARETNRWFEDQARASGRQPSVDLAGNLWACPDVPPPWWVVGSHLDTVAGGGRYDGALGVAAGFAIAEASRVPLAVVAFADEEGARFNTPTFGSRALTGNLALPDVLERQDGDGATLRDALLVSGIDPAQLHDAPAALDRVRGFVEIHIDQSRVVAESGRPFAVVTSLAGRMRVRATVRGTADHAGTTARHERSDALAAAAQLLLAAERLAAGAPQFVVTATRLVAQPNALTTVAGSVDMWFDARAPSIDDVDRWFVDLQGAAADVAAERRVSVDLATESRSPDTSFDSGLLHALTSRAPDAPRITCFAGHDAGWVSTVRPAAMLLVRNATGVSHSPHETIDLADAALACNLVGEMLRDVA